MINLTNIASYSTIGAFLISLCSIAYSTYRYLQIKEKDHKSQVFEKYHKLLRMISEGKDNESQLKVVCQIAYIYELRNFPEYDKLTLTTLNTLRHQWTKSEKNSDTLNSLKSMVDNTIAFIESKDARRR